MTTPLRKITLSSITSSARRTYLNTPVSTINNNLHTSFDPLSSTQIEEKATSALQFLDANVDITPFWSPRSSELSAQLPLGAIGPSYPILHCRKDTPSSWFSITENPLTSSFPLSPSLLPECFDLEGNKKEKPVRTLKGRILPTKEEEIQLKEMMEQSRWYYNFLVGAINSHYTKEKMVEKKSFSYYKVRDILTSYVYREEEVDGIIHRYYEERPDKETNTEQIIPYWWKDRIHNRLPRGVAKKITQNLNSMITNYTNGNIRDFELRCRSTKKTLNEFLYFEDKCFPFFIRQMKGQYWFTGKNGRKKRCSFQDLFNQTDPRGVEIIYEKDTGKYFFHYPVDVDFYPEGDRRNENQAPLYSSNGERIISLDPGVRKFMVGYDPNGKVVFVGKDAHKEVIQLLHVVDKTKDKNVWRKIKNKIKELHWQTINYLILHYDHIIIPDFKVSQMLKGKKISKQTKRMLCMYSFHSFILKLKHKCKKHGKKLYVVDESYTSKTCTVCGQINDVRGKETYKCGGCGNQVDRDINGSRNILIKNLK